MERLGFASWNPVMFFLQRCQATCCLISHTAPTHWQKASASPHWDHTFKLSMGTAGNIILQHWDHADHALLWDVFYGFNGYSWGFSQQLIYGIFFMDSMVIHGDLMGI